MFPKIRKVTFKHKGEDISAQIKMINGKYINGGYTHEIHHLSAEFGVEKKIGTVTNCSITLTDGEYSSSEEIVELRPKLKESDK